jgi:glutathione S-transferase
MSSAPALGADEPLFHLVAEPVWRAACQTGEYAPESLADEGFIHFSFRAQVAGSANRHYPDASDLIVIEVDPSRLPTPAVIEDSYGSGQAFPHVYAAIPTSAAVAEHPLNRDEQGQFVFS